jgi:hypothetical protein
VNELEEKFPHAWFIGLDFDEKNDPCIPDIAVKRTFGWLLFLARKFEVHLAPFVVCEPLYTGKRMSVHLILRSTHHISDRNLRKYWKLGNTFVDDYDPRKLGVEYIYDHHVGVDTRVVCSGKKPCRRNRKGKVFCTHEVNQVLKLQ